MIDQLVALLLVLPPVAGVLGALYARDRGASLKDLGWLLRRPPKAVQDKAAFEELYRWKRNRRLQDRTEWNARYTELMSRLPGTTAKRVQVGLTTERITIKSASGEIVTQFDQPISEYQPYYFNPKQGRPVMTYREWLRQQ